MSTRALVGIQHKDGTITSIYVHNDGYPEGLGSTLAEHWTGRKAVKQLVALGDASMIGMNLDNVWFYGRDAGETGTEAQTYPHLRDFLVGAEDRGAAYAYLLVGKTWRMHKRIGGKFVKPPIEETTAPEPGNIAQSADLTDDTCQVCRAQESIVNHHDRLNNRLCLACGNGYNKYPTY